MLSQVIIYAHGLITRHEVDSGNYKGKKKQTTAVKYTKETKGNNILFQRIWKYLWYIIIKLKTLG